MKAQSKAMRYLFAGILSAVVAVPCFNAQEDAPSSQSVNNEMTYVCIPKNVFEDLNIEGKDEIPSFYLYGEDGKLSEVKTNITKDRISSDKMRPDKDSPCEDNERMAPRPQANGRGCGTPDRDKFQVPPMMCRPPMDNKFVLLTINEFNKLNEQKMERMKKVISDRIQMSIKQAQEHAVEANVDGKEAKVLFIKPSHAPMKR